MASPYRHHPAVPLVPFAADDSGMATDSATPAASPVGRRLLSRRSALGVGAAASAGLFLGAPAARAATTAPSPSLTSVVGRSAPAGARTTGDQHVTFTRYTGTDFRRGTHEAIRWQPDGIRIGQHPVPRNYTDTFAVGATAVPYDQSTWTSPTVTTTFGLTELIASWDVETPEQTWVEVLVRGRGETGTRTGWFVLGRWCAVDPADGGAIHRTSVDNQGTDVATVYTDTFHAFAPHTLEDFQLRINLLRPAGTRQSPIVRMLGAVASGLPDLTTVPVSPVGRAAGRVINVPSFSQEVHVGHYPQWDNGGEAWCSATSSAMVLKYWGVGPTAADLTWVQPPVDAEVDFSARNVFDYTYNGCGNWPFNTAYAGRYGLEAFVTRLRSFTELEELVGVGIPVIISVSFNKGDLDGAGYSTNGHLIVVVGFTTEGNVVVNDPASHLIPDDSQVRTVYRRDQLENAWVPHSGGTVYVVHPRGIRLPKTLVPCEPNW